MHMILSLLLCSLLMGGGDRRPYSQDQQQFSIIHLPAKYGIDKSLLNASLAKMKTQKDVLTLLRSNPKLSNAQLVIRITKNNQNSWWKINFEKAQQKNGEWVVMQSKNVSTGRITKLRDIKLIFTDTLVVIDSLQIDLLIQDANHQLNGYYFTYNSGTDTVTYKSPFVSDRNGRILLKKALFESCSDLLIPNTQLRNNVGNQRLSNGVIRFLSNDEKEELVALFQELRSMISGISETEAVNYLMGYIKENYGTADYRNLIDQLINKKE